MSESSIRRNLKLNDEADIRQFSHQWRYLIHTIMQCMSPNSTGFNEFSSNIATSLVCLATNRVPSFSGRIVPLFDYMLVPHGEGSGTPTESHHTPTSEALQSSQHKLSSPSLPPVPTESLPTVIPSDNPPLSQGEACPTDSGFVADQDMANIAKTSTLPSDSAPRVTSIATDESSMQPKLDELTALCTSLQRQHSEMVSRGVADQFGDDAPIKGRRLDVGEEAAKRVSDDTEEMATVLTSMDAATVLSSRVAEVPTGSGSIPTAGPPATGVPTGSDVLKTKIRIF
nr:hypothetical protein [Tanacetum cinerariifolium]